MSKKDSVQIHITKPVKQKDLKYEKKDDWEYKIIDWCTFYRRNIPRFIEHYFQIILHPYQRLWIYYMSICDSFVAIASRASSKSWLIALFVIAISVLYPNSKVVVVAKTKAQAGVIFGKIEDLKKGSANIQREIDYFSNTNSDRVCKFFNGSTIKAVICAEGGRGERSTCTVGEEFRIMDKEKYDAIVRPFAMARQAPYMKIAKYAHLIEEPKEILISSAYYKPLWWYGEMEKNIEMMLNGEKSGAIYFDYPIAIKHGIKTKRIIAKDKEKMDAIAFQQEYENIPFGENNNAYFKLDMFLKNRDLKRVFYPIRKEEIGMTAIKNPYRMKRREGEVRVVAVDIATRKGKANDNTIITCLRGLSTVQGYRREVVYMESHQGEHTGKQALRIKQIYNDFEADYIVLDLQNAGIAVFEQLAVVTKDEERGVEYDAYGVLNHSSLDKALIKELQDKTLSSTYKPVIYPIRGNTALNSAIAVNFRDNLMRSMISIPIDNIDAEEYLNNTNKSFQDSEDFALKSWLLNPYIQISSMIKETIELTYTIINGNIRLEEPRNARKDRYSSCSYGNYFISLLEIDMLKNMDNGESEQLVFY